MVPKLNLVHFKRTRNAFEDYNCVQKETCLLLYRMVTN